MATSNSEWLQIYKDNLTGTSQPTALQWSDHVTDSTTLTTTTTTSSSNVSNQDGRVTRPTNTSRKSTRTSRRTPTTLLNADITNFRAMVQQFTGRDSSIAFMAAPATVTRRQPLTSYSANYGVASRISPPSVGGYSVEAQQLPHQQYYTMAVEDGGAGGGHHHRFVQKVQDGNDVANFPGEIYYGGNNTRIF